MKLSVIVPVYNVKPYLAKCIDSILNQTCRDLELILIDDGSTDGSADILADYAACYPEIIRTKRVNNGGQGRARNFGIDMAEGEYIGFIDSDDWIEPDMYEKLIARAENTGAELVFCDFMAHYSDGTTEYLYGKLHENKMSASGSCCNKLFTRELIGSLRYPEGLWYEDFYFSAMLLMRAEKVEYVREPLYIYRCGQVSTMHNTNAAKNLDMMKIMDMLESAMRADGRTEYFSFLLINHVLLDGVNRLAYVDTTEAKQGIETLCAYVRKKLPSLSTSPSFRRECFKRRLIMLLNYNGMYRLSRLILDTKKKLS